MAIEFKNSETRKNLMRAFAGESQARNRYCIAAGVAKNKNLYVIEAVFKFTAEQEREHAKIFYNHLKELAGEVVEIDGSYPVDISDSVAELLKFAQRNEYEEHDEVYKSFADTAQNEGFSAVAATFRKIAEIEKTHGDRFGKFAELVEKNKLFVSSVDCKWMCLNCGHVYEGKEAPAICPVCSHNQGYFIRMEFAPYEACKCNTL